MKRIVSGLLIVLFVLALASCSGSNPKDLAKQTYDLSKDALGSLLDLKKAAEIQKKAASIQKKVDKLSASDKKIYDEELMRLAGGNLGDLFDAASSLDIQDALNSAGNALDAAQKAADLLNSLK